jgi:hypothetical protein
LFEKTFDQFQYAAVGDVLLHVLHHTIVPDGFEGNYDTLPTSTVFLIK